MSKQYKTKPFPKSRVATLDIGEIGIRKHYISSFIEVDVTEARKKLKVRRVEGEKNSFTAYLIYEIANTLEHHPHIAAFLKNKRETIQFQDINVSLIVEKQLREGKVPIPHIIERAQNKTIEEITTEIHEVKTKEIGNSDLVLHRRTTLGEKWYPYFPKWLRLWIWKLILKNPENAYSKMGNVAFTSLGIVGKINGWFEPISIHPVCFGVGSIVMKSRMIDEEMKEREILHLSILMDHDVVDGVAMGRFIVELVRRIENFEY